MSTSYDSSSESADRGYESVIYGSGTESSNSSLSNTEFYPTSPSKTTLPNISSLEEWIESYFDNSISSSPSLDIRDPRSMSSSDAPKSPVTSRFSGSFTPTSPPTNWNTISEPELYSTLLSICAQPVESLGIGDGSRSQDTEESGNSQSAWSSDSSTSSGGASSQYSGLATAISHLKAPFFSRSPITMSKLSISNPIDTQSCGFNPVQRNLAIVNHREKHGQHLTASEPTTGARLDYIAADSSHIPSTGEESFTSAGRSLHDKGSYFVSSLKDGSSYTTQDITAADTSYPNSDYTASSSSSSLPLSTSSSKGFLSSRLPSAIRSTYAHTAPNLKSVYDNTGSHVARMGRYAVSKCNGYVSEPSTAYSEHLPSSSSATGGISSPHDTSIKSRFTSNLRQAASRTQSLFSRVTGPTSVYRQKQRGVRSLATGSPTSMGRTGRDDIDESVCGVREYPPWI